MTRLVYVLNGPNLNMLGVREPEIYGTETLADLRVRGRKRRRPKTVSRSISGNPMSRARLVNWVQEARGKAKGIIINAGGYTHTSVAILDALQAVALPVVEVHLSNIFRRDQFRQHSYISLAATGVICGLGSQGLRTRHRSHGRHPEQVRQARRDGGSFELRL